MTQEQRAQIFAEGDYSAGTLTWGWQCFGCREEDIGLANATTASEAMRLHLEFCDRDESLAMALDDLDAAEAREADLRAQLADLEAQLAVAWSARAARREVAGKRAGR